jgi:site-specific recombinase XerD
MAKAFAFAVAILVAARLQPAIRRLQHVLLQHNLHQADLNETAAIYSRWLRCRLQSTRTCCGMRAVALANRGVDTRSLQAYLGHKNIQHTVRYTELSRQRFKDFWRD